jgi:hypothetical protein
MQAERAICTSGGFMRVYEALEFVDRTFSK